MQIFCFGDSIVYGAWDKQLGWVSRLRGALEDQSTGGYKHLVYNFGVPGDTSKDLLARYSAEFQATYKEKRGQESIALFGIGANDAKFLPQENQFVVSEEVFAKNIEELLTQAKAHSTYVGFVQVLPVQDSAPDLVSPLKERRSEWLRNFDQILKKTLDENEASESYIAVPYFNEDDFSPDGLHPSDSGHEKIFNAVTTWIQPFISKSHP